jgi:hypothetical protein
MTHLVDDFCLNSEIARNEVKLVGNFRVRVNGAIYRCKRVREVAIMLIRLGEKSTCVGNPSVVADRAGEVDRLLVVGDCCVPIPALFIDCSTRKINLRLVGVIGCTLQPYK